MIISLMYANTFLNIMASAFVLFGAAKPHVFGEPLVIRIGAVLAVFGLMGQAMRNVQYFLTGVSPSDIDLPFWMLKDLGLFVMIFGYAMRSPMVENLKKK
jgi:hypothetical protein